MSASASIFKDWGRGGDNGTGDKTGDSVPPPLLMKLSRLEVTASALLRERELGTVKEDGHEDR